MKKHVLNIEGIPGSGKSTAAAQLDGLFRMAGIDSYWIREEASDHPIGTTKHSRTEGAEKLVGSYLNSWENFFKDNNQVAILDGYALQSTVRFLFAMKVPERAIHQYFGEWQKIGQLSSSIVFLEIENPEKHFREFVFPLRGESWCRKVSSYVSSTPLGQERGFVGDEGLIEFWSEYQFVCLELLRDCIVSTRIQNYTDRSWIETHLELMQHAAKD